MALLALCWAQGLRAVDAAPLVQDPHVHSHYLFPPGSSLSLCCATLQWLLAKNAAADAVRARALSSVQGVAPDGTAVHLTVRQASGGSDLLFGEVDLSGSQSEGPWAGSVSGPHLQKMPACSWGHGTVVLGGFAGLRLCWPGISGPHEDRPL